MTSTTPQPGVTSEMVERVARALFDAENAWRDMQQGLQGGQLPERHFKVAISEYRMKARAAIAAMRDLPPSVVRAGILADDKRTGYQTILHIHRAMIDEALK